MRLRDFTTARVELGRAGHSLPTAELLDFQLAHARARDAVHLALDVGSLGVELRQKKIDYVTLASAAVDRATYLHRPDLGRRLNAESRTRVESLAGDYDAAFIVADGLSALAVHRHAAPLLELVLAKLDWHVAPVAIVEQGRVAVGDEIGELLGAKLSVVFIGERPGLSSPDSLGIYLTWQPRTQLHLEYPRRGIELPSRGREAAVLDERIAPPEIIGRAAQRGFSPPAAFALRCLK